MVTGSQTLVCVEPQLDIATAAETTIEARRTNDFEGNGLEARMLPASLTAVRFWVRWLSAVALRSGWKRESRKARKLADFDRLNLERASVRRRPQSPAKSAK